MATVTFSRFVSRLPKRMCSAHHTLTTCTTETRKFSKCQERLDYLHSPVPNVGYCQNNTCRKRHTNSLSSLSPRSQSQRFFTTSARHFIQRPHMFQSSRTSRNSSSVIAAGGTETAREVPDVEKSQLQQRFVYVHTSVNRWEDVPGGLMFDTAYLDSKPGAKINAAEPLVVSLHNTPGSFHDMRPVLEAFAKSGCRVLAPAFPGGGKTEGLLHGYNDVFTHSTSEKAEFVRDFLVTLDVNKVDLLLGHGCGCYTTLRLAAGKDTASMFKSAAFLSPWPHRDFKGMSQTSLLLLLHDMWERPYYRPLARVLSRLVSHTSGVGSLERMTLVNTLYNLDFGEIGGLGVALDTQRSPWVMMFAEDDSYVEPQLLHELAHMMGLGEERVTHFTGQLTRGQMNQFPSCVVFDKGGQHLHLQQSGVITAILLNLLKSVRPGFAAL